MDFNSLAERQNKEINFSTEHDNDVETDEELLSASLNQCYKELMAFKVAMETIEEAGAPSPVVRQMKTAKYAALARGLSESC